MTGPEAACRHALDIGTAGWSIPTRHAGLFPPGASHLHRYAQALPVTEINSTFHRPHRASTYARWAASTPPHFRFAVKLPRTITHDARLQDTAALLHRFLAELEPLRPKLGPLLVQLPPSLAFDPAVAQAFFDPLRSAHQGPIACEPRHPTWFTPEADALLRAHHTARVAADPAPFPAAARPGGWPGLAYHRLHGSPRTYYSEYGPDRLATLAATLTRSAAPLWVIFDNTASGAAAGDAVALASRLGGAPATAAST